MPVDTLRDEFTEALLAFAWSAWSELGISGARPAAPEQRAVDPEALLLFSLELARHDPRLFDEILDWLAVNAELISVQRLRNLTADDHERALSDAALTWLGRWQPRARLRPRGLPATTHVALFRAARAPVRTPDPSFQTFGFRREELTPSGKSQPVDVEAPIAFAFRMRRLLGVGVRAEAARALLTIRAPRVQAQTITASAAFAARNVREALSQLAAAGVVDEQLIGGEHWYSLDHDRWAALLGLEAPALPLHDEWPQLLRAARAILLWLHEPSRDELSPYLRASAARTLIEDLSPALRYSGITPHGTTAVGEDYWDHFAATARTVARRITNP